MCLPSPHVYLQVVRGSQEAPGPVHQGAGISWPGMQSENRLGRVWTIQDPFLDHHHGAAVFAGRRSFLGRLEDELDCSG